ncbi:hypothetical protein PSTT_01750, partial [Puccinia striiformis]
QAPTDDNETRGICRYPDRLSQLIRGDSCSASLQRATSSKWDWASQANYQSASQANYQSASQAKYQSASQAKYQSASQAK